MPNSIMYLVDVTIKEGQKEALLRLIEKMVASAEKEPGALAYHWSISENNVHVIEHYADNDATLIHLNTFTENFAKDFMACVDVNACTVYGCPNTAVRNILDGFGSIYMGTIKGFVK